MQDSSAYSYCDDVLSVPVAGSARLADRDHPSPPLPHESLFLLLLSAALIVSLVFDAIVCHSNVTAALSLSLFFCKEG